MKINNLMSMLAAATAVGFCMSATAGDGQSGKLVLTDPVTNVNVTATTTPATVVGGTWSDLVPEQVGVYYEIDGDDTSTNVFTATEITSSKVVTCEFVLKPSPVSYTDSLPLPDSEAQVAFCIATNTSDGATLQAYVKGSGWTELTGSIPDREYTLTITLDYSGSTKYAKFAIDGTVLNNSNPWLAITSDKTGVTEYCFVGSGSLKSILTTGQDIKAEGIDITPPSGGDPIEIAVPEELVAALRDAGVSVGDMGTALTESTVNGASLLENYVIFGVTDTNEVTAATTPEAKIATTKTVDGDIPLAFQNLNVKPVSGVSVSYKLQGREKHSDGWSDVQTFDSAGSVKIPNSAIKTNKYREFKVVVTFEYN